MSLSTRDAISRWHGDSERLWRYPRSAGMSLNDVLSVVRTDVLTMLVAPRYPRRLVTTVQMWDPEDQAQIAAGAMVFAVGMAANSADRERLFSACTDAQATAIVIRTPPTDEPSWHRRRDETGVALLGLAPGVSWDRALGLTRTALTASGCERDAHPWDGGDLFELADAAAAALGCPVDVTDQRLRLIAFSSLEDDYDQLRMNTILRRRVPDEVSSWLRRSHQLSELTNATVPVQIEPPDCRPRVALAIRAGTEVIGYLWISPLSGKLDEAAMPTACGIARAFAVRISRAALPDAQRHGSDVLRAVLQGGIAPTALSAVFAPSDARRLQLVGFRLRDDAPMGRLERSDLEALVAMRIQSLGCAWITTAVGDTVYALIGSAQHREVALHSFAEDIVARAARQLGAKVVAVLGPAMTDLPAICRTGAALDRALHIHSHAAGADVIGLEDIGLQCILYELAEIAQQTPHLLDGRLQILTESDNSKNTAYIPTLRAYFDANCNLADAANASYLHRNTIRYRLQRITEISGLDINNPLDRFVTEMQLRLLGVCSAAGPGVIPP